MKSDILSDVVEWGSCDIESANKLIDDSNLDSSEVMEYARSIASEYGSEVSTDINFVFQSALQLCYNTFNDKLVDYIDNNDIETDRDISNIEINIYTNCLDSSYDSWVNDFDLTDFSDENFDSFLNEWSEQ